MKTIRSCWDTRQKVWTDEKIEWLLKSKEIYSDREDIVTAFNERFGTNIDILSLNNINTVHKLKLPPSHKRIEKGKENLKLGWLKIRSFEKKEIGEKINRGSSTQEFVKVSNSGNEKEDYILKTKYLYELYHNVKLDKNTIVIFLNGDKEDYSKENLYALDKQTFTSMMKNKLFTKDKETTKNRIKFCEWRIKLRNLERENEL